MLYFPPRACYNVAMETKAHVRATALAVLAVVLLAAWVSAFHVQLLLIHGDSMAPAYRSGSLVLLEKRVDEPSRGDVLLVRAEGLGRSIVKRAAAVGGDTLTVEDGVLFVNGVRAAELPPEPERAAFLSETPFVLPEGSLFLLGDNHDASVDSRDARVGLVPVGAVRGRVLFPRR